MARSLLLAVALAALLCAAQAFPKFVNELPNHPGDAPGVGHVATRGGGPRNAFGQVRGSAARPRGGGSPRVANGPPAACPAPPAGL